MNPFTEHTQRQGVTYFEHLFFAMGISMRLLSSVIAFVLHAMFPFIDIKREQDLEATIDYLEERNQWIEAAKQKSMVNSQAQYELAEGSVRKQVAGYCVRVFMLFV